MAGRPGDPEATPEQIEVRQIPVPVKVQPDPDATRRALRPGWWYEWEEFYVPASRFHTINDLVMDGTPRGRIRRQQVVLEWWEYDYGERRWQPMDMM